MDELSVGSTVMGPQKLWVGVQYTRKPQGMRHRLAYVKVHLYNQIQVIFALINSGDLISKSPVMITN